MVWCGGEKTPKSVILRDAGFELLSSRPLTTFSPLLLVLGVSMAKEALEDFKRRQADRVVNRRTVGVLNPATRFFESKRWRDIQVHVTSLFALVSWETVCHMELPDTGQRSACGSVGVSAFQAGAHPWGTADVDERGVSWQISKVVDRALQE